MAIYTKTGDTGTTALFGGSRVKKYALRVESYGCIDELNATISVAAKFMGESDYCKLLSSIEHQLFYFAAELASDKTHDDQSQYRSISEEDITHLELIIDEIMATVPTRKGFILPGACKSASFLHQARTVARRAERYLVRLSEEEPVRPVLLKYLNRLSDLLYAIACYEDEQYYRQAVIDEVVKRYKQQINTGNVKSDVSNATTADMQELPEAPFDLDFGAVHLIMQAAMTEAFRINVPVVITIVDEHGHVIITYRMPGSLLISLDVAPKKAYTAVAMQMATHELKSLVQPGGDIFQLEAAMAGKIITLGGGYPITIGKQIVGGLGVSGGSLAQDMQIAECAIDAFRAKFTHFE